MGKLEMPCLDHIRFCVKFGFGDKPLCDGCGGSEGNGYACMSCNIQAHEDCIEWTLKYECHPRHHLRLVSSGTLDYTDGKCHFCRKIPSGNFFHCSTCDFSVDGSCKRSEPYTISNPKSHNHTFTLLPRQISFTCNACGLVGERNPYVCVECNLMIHKACIDLPRVININRHDHRISFTYHLARGNWESCGVCRREIDWSFGGFSCKQCPNYAVHSKCATDRKVWDGIELEDEPEEEEDIEDPYTVINEKEIFHFSHEDLDHNLRLGEVNVTDFEKMRCDACILPLDDALFYKCVQCDFFLHNVCANLPRKKRHVSHTHKLDLQVHYPNFRYIFQCSACAQYSGGFRYVCNHYMKFEDPTCDMTVLDARCGSISEPFHHDLHHHPLYYTLEKSKTCVACGVHSLNVLTCTVCDFTLDIKCATLPTKVKHRCDDHFLSLCRGDENLTGELWCDICETKTDPKVWFYTCEDCGVTLHIKCVLGDFYYLKPGFIKGCGSEVIPNISMTRPFCSVCKLRCIFPAFFTNPAPSVERVCSNECGFSLEPKLRFEI